MATKIDIGGELNPRTVEGIVADASTIIDRTAEKRQDEINSEVSESLEGKQGVIADLETIRSGAASGSTAIQPTQIEDVVRHVDTGALEPLLDPSDYATTDQLNQLGQELNELDEMLNNRYLVSGYITSTFIFKLTNDLSVHSAILKEVSEGEKYYLIVDSNSMPRGDNRRVAFYPNWTPNGDQIENPISHTLAPSPNTWYELVVPTGAEYMAIQTRFTPSGQTGEGDPLGYHLYSADEYKLYKENKDAIDSVEQSLNSSINSVELQVQKIADDFEDVVGKNLFDKTQTANLGYINFYGAISDNTSGNYTYSYQIPIEENTYYYLTRNISGNSNIRCLDADGNPLKVLIPSTGTSRSDWALPNETGTSGAASGQFKTPQGAKKIQFNIRWNGVGDVDAVMLCKIGTEYIPSYPAPEYEQYQTSYKLKESALPANFKDSILSLLKGKSVCIFGGSVSRLCTTFGGSSVMESMSGVSVINKGQDGGGYAKDTTIVDGVPVFASGSIPDNVNQATQDGQPIYDIYLLWSSTNDLYVTPGDPSDYTFQDNYDVNKLTTQCGGINYCVKKLQEFAPESRLMIVGSLKAVGFTYVSDFLRLQTLVEKQKGVASLQSLPLISLWDISGANYYNRDAFFQWTIENEGESKNDGTHPNKWAYQNVIAPKLIKEIALLF